MFYEQHCKAFYILLLHSHFNLFFTVYLTTLLVSDNTAWDGWIIGDTNGKGYGSKRVQAFAWNDWEQITT